MIPLINGITYSYASITVNILGNPVAGITALKYSDEQEMQDNYGAGPYAVNRGFGTVKFDGSVTLMMEEVEALQVAAPNGRLQEIPEFNITVSFEQNGRVATHFLMNCRFKTNARDNKTGDLMIAVEIPLLIGQVKFVI